MRDPLRLTLAWPCPIDFPRMGADERERHCERCDKRVRNLSALTEDEAREVLAEPESLCVSFRRRPDGSVVFRAAVLASAAALAACVPHSPEAAAPPAPEPDCAPAVWSAGPSYATREGELRVLILDEGQLPLPGVLITLEGPAPQEALTDAEGRALIVGLPPGAVEWRASRQGFRAANGTLEMHAGRGTVLNVALTRPGYEGDMSVGGLDALPVIDTESGDHGHIYSQEWLQRVPKGGGFGR